MNGKGQPGSLAGETRDNGKLTERFRNPVTTTKWKVIAPWPGAPGHHSLRQREALKKLCLPHEPDPVGTRCPASGLGFRLWTRGSASLPFNLFPAPGYTQREDPMVRMSRLRANMDNHLPLTSMATMLPQIDTLPGTKRQASIQYGN